MDFGVVENFLLRSLGLGSDCGHCCSLILGKDKVDDAAENEDNKKIKESRANCLLVVGDFNEFNGLVKDECRIVLAVCVCDDGISINDVLSWIDFTMPFEVVAGCDGLFRIGTAWVSKCCVVGNPFTFKCVEMAKDCLNLKFIVSDGLVCAYKANIGLTICWDFVVWKINELGTGINNVVRNWWKVCVGVWIISSKNILFTLSK